MEGVRARQTQSFKASTLDRIETLNANRRAIKEFLRALRQCPDLAVGVLENINPWAIASFGGVVLFIYEDGDDE